MEEWHWDNRVFGEDRPEAFEFEEDYIRDHPHLEDELERLDDYRNVLARGIHQSLDNTLELMATSASCAADRIPEHNMLGFSFVGSEVYQPTPETAHKLGYLAQVYKDVDEPRYLVTYEVIGPPAADDIAHTGRKSLAMTHYHIRFDEESTNFSYETTLVSLPAQQQPAYPEDTELTEDEHELFDLAAGSIDVNSIYALRQFRDFLDWLKRSIVQAGS